MRGQIACVLLALSIAACTSDANSGGSASNRAGKETRPPQRTLEDCAAETAPPVERDKACSQALQSATLSDSERATLLVFRGVARLHLDQDQFAVRDLDQAIALDPKSAWAQVYRGLAAIIVKDPERAAMAFDTAIRLNPSMPEAYSDRGMLFIQMGEFENAIPALDKSIQLNSRRADPYYWRSIAYAHLGHQKQAESDLAGAKAIDPGIVERRGDPLATLKPASSDSQNEVNACASEAESDQRIANCTAALRDDLEDEARATVLILRAGAYLNKDPAENQLAFNDANTAIAMLPKSSYAYHTRGLAEWDLGRKDEAMADFSKAIDLEPGEAVHWFTRGSYSQMLGDQAAAEADYAKAVELDPMMEAAIETVRNIRSMRTNPTP